MQLMLQIWQETLGGLSHQIEVGLEVAMNHSVAHTFHLVPGNIRSLPGKCAVLIQDLGSCLADHQNFQDDGIILVFFCPA